MIHKALIQLLRETKDINIILYFLLVFLIAYILLGIATGIIFVLDINLKEICVLSPVTKFKDKIIGTITVIVFWPYALYRVYDLWYNLLIYMSCLLAGSTFRRNIMTDKSVIQLKEIVNDNKGNTVFKKIATTNMGCIEELITDEEEHNGDTYVTIYGLGDEPSSQIVPPGISFCNATTLDFLKELKANGLVGLQRVEAEQEIKFEFDNTAIKSFNLVFPESVFCYIFDNINAVYVTQATETDDDKISDSNLMEFQSQLCNEVHVNSYNILFMIDYTNHEAYALNSDLEEIMNCEYEGNDPEDRFTRVKVGDTILRYIYSPTGYLDRIDVEKTDEDNTFGYYLKIVERDEVHKRREHVTVTYMVPYIKDTGNVLVYSTDCRLYRTDNIYLEKGKITEWQIDYRILSDKEEDDLNDAFTKTVENSVYIVE